MTPVVESYTKEESENGIFYSIATKMFQFFENDCNIECDLLGSTGTIITWRQEKRKGGWVAKLVVADSINARSSASTE